MFQRIKSIVRRDPTCRKVLTTVRQAVYPKRTGRISAKNDQLRHCLSRLTDTLPDPVFVKVGANDGITADPCGDVFLKNSNWTGILIEPVPYLAERLQSNYRDQNRFTIEQVAVGTDFETKAFYYVDEYARSLRPGLPGCCDKIGSFDRQHILKHGNGVLEPFIVRLNVNVQPLDEILRRNNLARIDFLQIDVEGHDLQALKSINLDRFRPSAIFIEHKHLSTDDRTEMRSRLNRYGYCVRDTGPDFFATLRNADNQGTVDCK